MVAAAGTPPAADTFWSGIPYDEAKTITPSRFQVPPRLSGVSHTVTGGPPATSTFLSFPSAKNPRNRLSGDQSDKFPLISICAATCRTSQADLSDRARGDEGKAMAVGEIARGTGEPKRDVVDKLHRPPGNQKRIVCVSAGVRLK